MNIDAFLWKLSVFFLSVCSAYLDEFNFNNMRNAKVNMQDLLSNTCESVQIEISLYAHDAGCQRSSGLEGRAGK